MLNQCNFIGRLGNDPETRRLQSGKPVVNFSLAVSKKWRDANGEKQERTTWVPVVIFSEGLCKVAEQFLSKGSLIQITGEFTTRKWQDQNGQDRYSTEIVLQGYNANLTMIDGPKGDKPAQGAPQGDYGGNQSTGYDSQGNGGFGGGAMDDGIPF